MSHRYFTESTVAGLCRARYCAVAVLVAGFAGVSLATPTLQLYAEGAEYDEASQSWRLTASVSSQGTPFRLWAIGNVSGPGGKGTIENVRLAVAYGAVDAQPTITLTPSTTEGFGGVADPSVPAGTGHLARTVTDGSRPVITPGHSLPSQGVYGPGVYWQEFSLGSFAATDSPVGDFSGAFPSSWVPNAGQINVYEVSVLGGHGLSLHFDLYGTVNGDKARFSPVSVTATVMPVPGAMVLAGTGMGLLVLLRRRLS